MPFFLHKIKRNKTFLKSVLKYHAYKKTTQRYTSYFGTCSVLKGKPGVSFLPRTTCNHELILVSPKEAFDKIHI